MNDLTPKPCPRCLNTMVPHFHPGGPSLYCPHCGKNENEMVADKTEPKVVRVAYETMQFFEVDLPEGADPETYCETKEAREHFASLILSGFIDFTLERKFDADRNEL